MVKEKKKRKRKDAEECLHEIDLAMVREALRRRKRYRVDYVV